MGRKIVKEEDAVRMRGWMLHRSFQAAGEGFLRFREIPVGLRPRDTPDGPSSQERLRRGVGATSCGGDGGTQGEGLGGSGGFQREDGATLDAASQGILLGSVQVPSLDSAETSLECGDSLAEGTLKTRRTTGDSVETSSRGDEGRAEADTREIAEGLELHSRPPKHGHLWASHSGEGDAETVVPEEEEEVEGSRQVGEFEQSTEVSRWMR
uniref:Uncharacterized protein n=1 Tax=Chromera velia CCMP2878 TaxID=1169474 RepID=A0A0G4HL88_9ALVE|eukprot:Cvel_1139.t1-p1 / transcript=Cvel_1139.t1 / gene=Cvel_1139 / organism=Chromera_velia_CCMP2878 / gene_product=hypothetical protein / transcript_product=hypothetical protein / location=Cvel_scaffold37:148050-150786(+) / protein_length=209 / sequence_SO=supercontig / SO=protein_coding / is_pseudo=false